MKKKLGIIIAIAVLAALPLIIKTPSFFFTANMTLMYVILGVSINLLTGLSGQFSFGHVGFLAIGAYTSAIFATRFSMPFLVCFAMSLIVGGFVGFVLAFPCMRVKGSYLSLLTWTFAEIVRMILINWTSVTGGVVGIREIPSVQLGPIVLNSENKFYYLSFAVALLATFIFVRVKNSRVGSAFLAIKQDSLTAGVLGIDVPRYKLLSFILSASIAAAAGSLFAYLLNSVTPESFTLSVSGLTIQVALLGGFGLALAPWVGSTLIYGVGEMLRPLGGYREVVIGVVVLLVLLFSPDGLVGMGEKVFLKFTQPKTQTKKEGVQ